MLDHRRIRCAGSRSKLPSERGPRPGTRRSVDLDKERKATTRLWAKREAQIRGVIESTVGMYGDLQGIAGKTFQEIDGLDMQLLEPPKENSDSLDANEENATRPVNNFHR